MSRPSHASRRPRTHHVNHAERQKRNRLVVDASLFCILADKSPLRCDRQKDSY